MIRIKDLPHSTSGTGVHLSCPTCGYQFSATAGDYFMLPPNTIMRCQLDSTLLQLTRTVRREVRV